MIVDFPMLPSQAQKTGSFTYAHLLNGIGHSEPIDRDLPSPPVPLNIMHNSLKSTKKRNANDLGAPILQAYKSDAGFQTFCGYPNLD